MPRLSRDLASRIGQRTEKGTNITKELVRSVYNDEQTNLRIEANNAKVIAEAMNNAVLKALEAVGLEVQRIASDQAPVDTGRLAASITHAIDPSEPAVYIGTNVEYAAAQELGVSSTGYKGANGGKGYLRPAAENNKKRIQDIFTHALKNA